MGKVKCSLTRSKVYRQNVLSRIDALSPPQSRRNLTALFDALSENHISHVEVSSSCADVTLTSQPSFLNNPIAICAKDDKCVKVDFDYSGIRTAFVYKAELFFCVLILICGFIELILYDCYVIFLVMLIISFSFLLLYLEFYFGSVYNCAPLLHLHTLSAAFLAFAFWLSCLIPIFFMDAVFIASRDVT
uniref:Uncharacterized protein n=1 Tax=Caenorhabditis japonica TaxID=281687 RepID=A0A8R1I3D1_CAEJA